MSIDELYRHFGPYGIRVLPAGPVKDWSLPEQIDFVERLSKHFDKRNIDLVRFCRNHRVTLWMRHKFEKGGWLDSDVWDTFQQKVLRVWPGSKIVKGPILHKPAPYETSDGREIWLRKSPRPGLSIQLPGRKRGRKSKLTST